MGARAERKAANAERMNKTMREFTQFIRDRLDKHGDMGKALEELDNHIAMLCRNTPTEKSFYITATGHFCDLFKKTAVSVVEKHRLESAAKEADNGGS